MLRGFVSACGILACLDRWAIRQNSDDLSYGGNFPFWAFLQITKQYQIPQRYVLEEELRQIEIISLCVFWVKSSLLEKNVEFEA